MKRIFFIGLVLAALAVAVMVVAGCNSSKTTTTTSPKSTPSTTKSTGGTASVTIADFSFTPSTLTVSTGTTVTWTNNGPSVHTVTGTGWDSGQLQPGATYSHTFSTAGTYNYHCTNHPMMTATVTVGSSTSGGTTGGKTATPNSTTAPY